MSKSITVNPLKDILESSEDMLKSEILFGQRSLSNLTWTSWLRENTGTLKCDLKLEAHEGEPDDIIILEAALGQTCIANFKLTITIQVMLLSKHISLLILL